MQQSSKSTSMMKRSPIPTEQRIKTKPKTEKGFDKVATAIYIFRDLQQQHV
jgi:hypothetical protein